MKSSHIHISQPEFYSGDIHLREERNLTYTYVNTLWGFLGVVFYAWFRLILTTQNCVHVCAVQVTN